MQMQHKGANMKRAKKQQAEPVNPWAMQHGDYHTGEVANPDFEFGSREAAKSAVIINRGGSAIERWLNEKGGMFDDSRKAAIRHCQHLWTFTGGTKAMSDGIRVGVGEGWREQHALAELDTFKRRLNDRDAWEIFENVCRWDEASGRAGSKLANSNRDAAIAARAVVWIVSGQIAKWREK